MKVSIITTCKNSAETIEDTIVSVLSQDYSDIEYIVIDGNSNDETLSIIEKYRAHIHVFISEPDNGFYYALNKGIGRATGDVVGILNADDFYASKSVISEVVKTFVLTNSDAVYGDLHYVDRSDTSKIIRNWVSGNYTKGLFLKGWMPPHPTFFVKRNLYEQFGVFDVSFKSAADYELMLRFIHKHQVKIAYLPLVFVKMRVGGKSNVSLKNRLKANLEDRRAWKVNGIRPHLLTLIYKPLRKLSQFWN